MRAGHGIDPDGALRSAASHRLPTTADENHEMHIADLRSLRLRARLTDRAGGWAALHRPAVRAHAQAFLLDVVVPFATTRLVLGIVAIIATAALPLSPWIPASFIRPGVLPVLDAFSRWDGLRYVEIAQNGYSGSDPTSVAFFPLYPLLMRAGATLTGSVTAQTLEVWGLVISNLSLLIAAGLLVALARLDFDAAVASRAAWFLLIFPTSFFLSSIYAESLFLALSVGSLLAARRERWVLAGALGGLAALSRPFGFVIALPLAIEAFLQWRRSAGAWLRLAGVLAAPAALAGYCAWLWSERGDPLVFLHVEKYWHRTLVWPWRTFVEFFSKPITVNAGLHSGVDLGFALFTIAGALAAWRLLRPSYAAYVTALTVIPLSSGSLGSIGRFDVVFFPLILVLAALARRPQVDRALTVLGLGLGGLFMALFARWYWVA